MHQTIDTMMSMMDKSMGDHMDMKDDAMDAMEDAAWRCHGR